MGANWRGFHKGWTAYALKDSEADGEREDTAGLPPNLSLGFLVALEGIHFHLALENLHAEGAVPVKKRWANYHR